MREISRNPASGNGQLHQPGGAVTLAGPMWEVFKEFLLFLKQEKKWWLVPIVVILIGLGALLVFGAGSPLAPFIYSLF